MKITLHEALRTVRDLQQAILEKQRFKGYSGRARALAGLVALGAGIILGSSWVPAQPNYHLAGWGIVFVIALILNYGALIYWFLHDPDVARDPRRLRPALEILPTLCAGAVITFALVNHGEYDLLFGAWMVIFGLIHFTARSVLPRGLPWVGFYYLVCGAVCLLFWPGLSFTKNPLAMGGIFFAGEFLGGLVLHYDGKTMPSLRTFFGLPTGRGMEE